MTVSLETQKLIARLWVRGHSLTEIALSVGHRRATVTKYVKALIDVGILVAKPEKQRIRNPKGGPSPRGYWSKTKPLSRRGTRYCPHQHYMSKKNTIVRSDGTLRCRKCYNIDQFCQQRLKRSGFLEEGLNP